MQMHSLFHDSVANWFSDRFGEPTPVQEQSWPIIAAGKHILATAPTGSGKTLTAFLSALSHFASGEYESGRTQVLYISPLKALNNDIQRNLFDPLQELEEKYGYPRVRVGTRSGDTPQGDRQRMLRNPPEILITTPESLSLMLTTLKGRLALSYVETVIMDEIHSIVDNRRGVQLMTNMERLADLAGEFQRIALSATVNPLEAVADYIAGHDQSGHKRQVEIVSPEGTKTIDFRVRFPEAAKQAADQGKKIWDPLSDDFKDIIEGNTATLFFTNSRRLAEKITLKINQDEVGPVAYAHHGSLAREVRTEVEHRLKNGGLKAIVATNSLEMGIDIGHLDEVVMVQSPPSVASTLQRVGRAGHQVGETSVGTLYPTHAQDFLEAAVLAQAVASKDIEPLAPMQAALDVLAQIVLSICATDPWPTDDIFTLVTRARPYQGLNREQFDLVIEMLSGRYAGSRIRELKSRVTHDRINHTVQATRGAILSLYNSGGTIPDRGYYKMRHLDTGGILGELDEEFVWEATIGDTFTLGTQHWQVHRITHNDVIVRAAKAGSSAPPFWRSETYNRSYHFSSRIAQYLEMQEDRLGNHNRSDLIEQLTDELGFETTAASELTEFLERQREHTETQLPHRHHLLLELVRTGPAGYKGPDDPQQLVIHTYWGGRLNQPYALALRAAWKRHFGGKLDIHADNNAVVLQCKGEVDPSEVINLVNNENLPELLRESLESSGFFGARFRECAGRSLLLTKQRFNQRLPLWMSRMQAKKLMTQVKTLQDFPVMLETWRTCLDDEFDLPNLTKCLNEIQDGTITWSFITAATPSPFSQNLTFNQVSRYMYADDSPEDDALSGLGDDLIANALHNDALRPRIGPGVVEEFVQKRQRTFPDYEPRDDEEWLEWLKERILIPGQEMTEEQCQALDGMALVTRIEIEARAWYCHDESLFGLSNTGLIPEKFVEDAVAVQDPRTAWQFAREILSFYGPLSSSQITALLPTTPTDLLEADESFIFGQLLEETEEPTWCDAENFEILMRMQRAQRRADFTARPISTLPSFWAGIHRLASPASEQNVLNALETMRGYSNGVSPWLHDFLASRLISWLPHQLDDYLERFGMVWLGSEKKQITFAYPEDLDLLKTTSEATAASWFPDSQASYRYEQIVENQGSTHAGFNEEWWQAVWRGELTSDSVMPLIQGIDRKFNIESISSQLSSRRRIRRPGPAWSGYWRLTPATQPMDPLTRLEADKDLVRLLLDRYGFLNRDLVQRENFQRGPKAWRWRDAFRALRIMELGGEVFSGQFFTDMSTPQFITPRNFTTLQTNQVQGKDFWISALDPVAPTGLSIKWEALPQRRQGNYLAFHGGVLALVLYSNGRELEYLVPPEHDDLDAINAVLEHLVYQRRLRVVIDEINKTPSKQSPYLGSLNRLFRVGQDHKSIFLETKH
ncbi:MAG: DEAD/DEAH box helicase [Pseudomonadales bacterium]|nr:DEAD/DEAH box helicase [Pseudomonadales bacterium]